MAREFNRSDRVADFIKRELSVLIQRSMRDPRVQGANINAVSVTRDMSIAKVYVTFLGQETHEESKDAIKALEGAAGFLRSELASMATMRSIPKLRFYFDEVARSSEQISSLIDQALSTHTAESIDKSDSSE